MANTVVIAAALSMKSRKSKQCRFPVARIKKIMQVDEEVGKVAQTTPVVISKSLELFMQQLIDETIKETRNRGAKKVTAYHLKQTILQTDTFDFLRDIVAKVPDPLHDDGTEPKRTRTKKEKVEVVEEDSD